MGKLPFEKRKSKILVRDKNIKITKLKPKTAEELLNCGIINLDKPAPMLSKVAARKIKNNMEIWKAGHAGTLDPAVTGVLPIFLAKARKLSGILTNAGKEYYCWMRIHDEIPEAKVKAALKKFTGKITQLPPRISAVKRVERVREIYYVDYIARSSGTSSNPANKVSDIKKDKNTYEFIIGCQAGTYIRKYCHDIGEYLGTGGHMAKLVRTKAGPFKLKDSIKWEDVFELYGKYMKNKDDKLIQKLIRPVEEAVDFLPKVWVDDDVLPRLKNGSPIFAPGIVQAEDDIKVGDIVACYTTKSILASVGFAEMDSKQMIKEKKGLAIKTDVVMI
jgi:H/ACA ribonucleoprotein complex subunit 4